MNDETKENALVPVSTVELNKESLELINQIVVEQDHGKIKDLTALFNINQNKKTIARVNKLSDLMDALTDQALVRLTTRPDEISNKELMDGLKTVQDLIERGQKQVSGAQEAPLIQINQQNIETNVGGKGTLNRDSRERVKNAVMDLLKNVSAATTSTPEPIDVEVISGDVNTELLEEVEEDD